MREPLAIAYLLARSTDNLADSPTIPVGERLALLEELEHLLGFGDSAGWKPRTKGGFPIAESALMDSVPSLLAALDVLPDREIILSLWRSILQGQLFDLRRFAPGAGSLNAAELDYYCGTVAGGVGRTWTTLIARHSPGTLLKSPGEMEKLGVNYGKGLQLLNILRDRDADRLLGRRYVGDGDLSGLFELAGTWLRSGGDYLCGLRPGRILMATSMPLDLALPALELVRLEPDGPGVKLPRRMVRRVLVGNITSLWLRRAGNRAS